MMPAGLLRLTFIPIIGALIGPQTFDSINVPIDTSMVCDRCASAINGTIPCNDIILRAAGFPGDVTI